ncbi:MAG: D-aminoacylase [Immundisolibacterales bacterium]|nr:D-aminoacylase [Immundisolibacterales bacterium]
MSDTGRRCDIVIRHGTLVDGTGGPPRAADVAISGERIAAVGDLGAVAAEHEIDASGRAVAPGFIDVHTHDDRALLSDPDMAFKASQGVTTVVIGNCGSSLAPLEPGRPTPPPLNLFGGPEWWRFPTVASYVTELERAPAAINTAILIGHATLRTGAMDDLDRPATDTEIAVMQERLEEGMAAGAIGFSTGLFYPPNRAAPTDEVVALAEVAARAGGVHTTHMRDEHDHVLDSLDETFEIGSRAKLPVVVSHHKCAGPRNFGRTRDTLRRIDDARRTQEVGLDVYPYTAGSSVLLPALIEDSARVLLTWSEPCPEMAGRDLAEIAAEWGVDILAAADRLQPAGAVYFMMDEEDVRRILAYPHSMIGSDGSPHDEKPHPRLWGTFPRVLGHYSREVGLFPLQTAVHKMTGLAAARFGFADRGVVRPGAAADIVIFDPAAIIDRATYDDPVQPAAGIHLVMANGEAVWDGSRSTGARPGRVLRRG